MTEHSFEADYVIVGAGAVAMAFADTLLTDTEASIIMLDRRHKPGGHWTDSYPFVRLHGPSINYGVNSRPLGTGRIDQIGLNKGLHELAGGHEI
jgi:cation diffusion facilitator CzcD-associated flavoprotein CzcO